MQRLQSSGAEFDLYMVGSRQDDARIRDWAKRAQIDPARVRAGSITLNHDSGRWLALGLSGDLPAAVREVKREAGGPFFEWSGRVRRCPRNGKHVSSRQHRHCAAGMGRRLDGGLAPPGGKPGDRPGSLRSRCGGHGAG